MMPPEPGTTTQRRHLHRLASEVLRKSDRIFGGEYYGWGLDDKRPFGGSGRDSVGVDILLAVKPDGIDAWNLPTDTEDAWIEYAHGLYSEVGSYIRQRWAKDSMSRELEMEEIEQ